MCDSRFLSTLYNHRRRHIQRKFKVFASLPFIFAVYNHPNVLQYPFLHQRLSGACKYVLGDPEWMLLLYIYLWVIQALLQGTQSMISLPDRPFCCCPFYYRRLHSCQHSPFCRHMHIITNSRQSPHSKPVQPIASNDLVSVFLKRCISSIISVSWCQMV
jgi:hypothetical protein